jgi:hypothetical protein
MSRAWRWLLPSLLALAGCGPIYTDIDEPQVCKTLSNLAVPGVPAGTVPSVAVPLSLDLRKELGNTNGVIGEVEVLQTTLTARSGITDFGFLQAAELDIEITNTGGGFVPAVQYQRPTPYSPSSVLSMPGNGANLFPYVKTGTAGAALVLTGDFPTSAWNLDAEICVHVRLTH